MRATYSDVAAVQLEHNVEDLERKLVALRAEIDAVLSRLASEKVAAPMIEAASTLVAVGDAADPAPTAPAHAEITPEPVDLSGEGSRQPADAMPIHAAGVDQPSAVASASETAPEASSSEILGGDSLAPLDAIDETTPIAETAEAAAAQGETQADPAREAAIPIAPAMSVEPDTLQPMPAEASAAAAPERDADSLPAPALAPVAPAAVQAIGPELRRPDTLAPTASRRRLATKIAASIIALLVAATLLAIADKQAVGSAPTLPWMMPLSQVPAKTGAPLIEGHDSTIVQGNAQPARATADETLLLRYREAWPMGW